MFIDSAVKAGASSISSTSSNLCFITISEMVILLFTEQNDAMPKWNGHATDTEKKTTKNTKVDFGLTHFGRFH